MATFNLPFGVYRSTRGDLDAKYRVLNDTARDDLIINDLIKIGHVIYHIEDGERYELKTYPTFGSLHGVVWRRLFPEEPFISDFEEEFVWTQGDSDIYTLGFQAVQIKNVFCDREGVTKRLLSNEYTLISPNEIKLDFTLQQLDIITIQYNHQII